MLLPIPTGLRDQFNGFVQGRILIVDADGPAYVASSKAKTVATAVKTFQQIILTKMFLTESKSASLHLTAASSHKNMRFSVLAYKPYQGNRVGKDKPALLEATRYAVAQESNWLPEYSVCMHHVLEADDGMIIEAHQYKQDGVTDSEDKDLRMTPYPFWDAKTGRIVQAKGFGEVFLRSTPAGSVKCLGLGLKFFWAQMLMGDTADNIKGVERLNGKLCGPAATFEALNALHTQDEVANYVFDAYRVINQNPIPEAWLLWLLRTPLDNVFTYFSEIKFSEQNAAYLVECQNRKWFKE